MLFSIIIPMYNVEKYICKTLSSILSNDLSECELILIDDGSEDNTIHLADALLKEKCTCKYQIIKKSNTGVSDTRNKGIQSARGKYIIFCDGDDLFEPDLLKIVKEYGDYSTEMMAWPFFILQGQEKKLSQEVSKNTIFSSEQMLRMFLLKGYKVRLGSFAVKRDFLMNNNICFTEECTYAEDIEFVLKCIVKANKIKWIQEPLYCYVKREGSLVNSFNIRRFEAPRAIWRVSEYIRSEDILLPEDLKEYIENGLFITHYIYSLEGCILNISTWSEAGSLYNSIQSDYLDIKKGAEIKLHSMKNMPVGISVKRIQLLKLGVLVYIYTRLMVERIKLIGKRVK